MKEDVLNACVCLLKKFNKKFDPKILEEILSYHANIFSIKSISDALRYFGLANMVVNISSSDLLRIPLPAIAYCKSDDHGYFTAITQIRGTSILFSDQEIEIEKPLQEFEDEWTGVILLAEKANSSLYRLNKKHSLPIKAISIFLVFSIFSIMFFQITSLLSSFLVILSLLGVCFSLLSLLKSKGEDSIYADALCKNIKWGKLDCGSVLSTNVKLFGISIPITATAFFMYSLITHLFAYSLFPLLWMSILALPIVIFLIFKQLFILKKICAICLIIAMIYLAQLSILFIFINTVLPFELGEIYFHILVYLLSMAVCFTINEFLDLKIKSQYLENELHFYKSNEDIFKSQISTQPKIEIPRAIKPITINPDSNKNIITSIISFDCKHCLSTLKSLKALVEVSPDSRFEILLHVNGNQKDNQAINYFMNNNDPQILDDIISYHKTRNLNPEQEDDSYEYVKAYDTWKNELKLNYFPQVYFNYFLLPTNFTVKNLLFLTS